MLPEGGTFSFDDQCEAAGPQPQKEAATFNVFSYDAAVQMLFLFFNLFSRLFPSGITQKTNNLYLVNISVHFKHCRRNRNGKSFALFLHSDDAKIRQSIQEANFFLCLHVLDVFSVINIVFGSSSFWAVTTCSKLR